MNKYAPTGVSTLLRSKIGVDPASFPVVLGGIYNGTSPIELNGKIRVGRPCAIVFGLSISACRPGDEAGVFPVVVEFHRVALLAFCFRRG